MNCEKCKNKKATTFFADEDGGRHALCAACAKLSGKTGSLIPQENTFERSSVECSLLFSAPAVILSTPEDGKRIVCRICGLTSDELIKSGELGCPECYVAFEGLIAPANPTADSAFGARMPSARRARLERERILISLRGELRRAVDSESFELAATLRDKIRTLEKG